MSPEEKLEVMEKLSEWNDAKAQSVSQRLFCLMESSIDKGVPNLVGAHEVEDLKLLIKGLKIHFEEPLGIEIGESEDENGHDDSGSVLGSNNSSVSEPEENITSEDKGALAEFAQKLADKAEAMPVTAVIDPGTQEEASVLPPAEGLPSTTTPEESRSEESSTLQTPQSPKDSSSVKKGGKSTSKKAGKK